MTATAPAVRVLGPVEVFGPLGRATLARGAQRELVGLLALHTGSVVALPKLVDALWGEAAPRTAARTLHSHVARVRQALQTCGLPDAVLTRDAGYLLALPPAEVDAHRFADAVRRARDQLARDALQPAVEAFQAGLAMWRGDALADCEPQGWAVTEIERWHELRLSAYEDMWDARLRLGEHAAAVTELERMIVTQPVRERLVELLMLALYRSGRSSDALDRYERLRTRLAAQLGVHPGARVTRLHTAVLRSDPGLGGVVTGEPTRAPTPAQLPPPTVHFAGRADQLAMLNGWLDDTDARIAVVCGSPGVGKTALAVHWAWQASERFPDGRLFLDLRGHDPDSALTPAAAMAHALRGLGVPAERVPADQAEQGRLYHSLVDGRRILVVLDNAGTADHVLPLVPPSAGSALLVTSRQQLVALSIRHTVHTVALDVLTEREALALLGQVLGANRVAAEVGAARELVELCDRLPLALRIAAAKLAERPRQRIGDLVTELAGHGRLDALSVTGGSPGLRQVFASAYEALSEPAARLFRLLGLHPGTTFGYQLAAALTGVPSRRARRSVDELAAAQLIIEADGGRYRFHDLIRLYAAECTHALDPPEHRTEATARILDWYLGIAAAANALLDPARDRVRPTFRFPLTERPFPDSHAAALDCLDAERANLLSVVEFAAKHGHDAVAWQLAYLLGGFFESRGHWVDRVTMCRWGLAAAQHGDDPTTEGLMRSGLGVACIAARRFTEALEHLGHALALMRASGDKRGEGHAHNNMGTALAELRRFDEAVEAFTRALAVHTANGHRPGAMLASNNLGFLYAQTGRTRLSLQHLDRALALAREDGNIRFEAAIEHSTGQSHRYGGDLDAALACFDRALALRRQIGDRRYEARTRYEIGTTHLQRGDHGAAVEHLSAAHELSREIADQHLEAIALAGLGRAHLLAGESATARTRLESALRLRTRIPDDYELANIHRSLAELEQRSSDPAAAKRHRRRAIELYTMVNATTEADELAGVRYSMQ
jgi:DNA-binding SARP family transcriptional activator/tetratricopeptide (TPR) repeat protein